MDPLGFEMIGIVTLTPPVLFVVQTQKKVKKCSQFQAFTNLHLKKVAQCFAEEYFQSGSTVIKEGDVGSRFYIIKSGTVSIRKDDTQLAELSAGESFGEISLLGNKARNAGKFFVRQAVCLSVYKKMRIISTVLKLN